MGRKGMGILNNIQDHLVSREWKFVSTIMTWGLWCSQSGDHLQKDIAKFSYRPDEKVENKIK